jgi:hypothetical protein
LEEGLLHAVSLYDSTGHLSAGTELTMVRVSPSSPAGTQITAESSSGEGPPPSREDELAGIWLLESTGLLVRFSADGTYALDDGGQLGTDPDDQGTFGVDRDGSVTLTSGAQSRTCAEGITWVWKDVRLIFGAGTLRGVVSKDEGQRRLGPELTWVRLSP